MRRVIFGVYEKRSFLSISSEIVLSPGIILIFEFINFFYNVSMGDREIPVNCNSRLLAIAPTFSSSVYGQSVEFGIIMNRNIENRNSESLSSLPYAGVIW